MRKSLLVLVSGVLLAACGSGASTKNQAVPSSPATSGSEISGTFDVGGGKKLYVECFGSKGPTIVIDVGGEDTIYGSWTEVYEPMKAVGRVCAYDRANLGRSDPDPGPRTISDAADDLVTLLHLAKAPGPYVFVGGSFGGNIVGVLAARHPEEVAGLVFVDSDPANVDPKLDPFRLNLPAKTYQECCSVEQFQVAFNDPANVEHFDWKGGFAAELASIHQQPKVPTIVLSATRFDCDSDWPCDAIIKDDQRLQREWIKGNPQGSQKIIDSGHVMQSDAPQAIVDAAKAVAEAAR